VCVCVFENTALRQLYSHGSSLGVFLQGGGGRTARGLGLL
jgi:hypothetical protein